MGSYVVPTADMVNSSLDLKDFLTESLTPGGGNNEGPGIGDIGGIFG